MMYISTVKQICVSRLAKAAHQDPNKSGPPSITIVCLTRYLIELYGYLSFFDVRILKME